MNNDSVQSAPEDRIYKFKNRYLIYSIQKRATTNKLAIIFSGVDSTAGFCRMSYYSMKDRLNATVVHIMDNFGAHGCYLLGISGDQQIRNATISLIRELQRELGLSLKETYFIGTSKGASISIAYAMMCGGGTVIGGEPQIHIGDFIYSPSWEGLEQWRSIAYAILGRVSPDDKEQLNKLIPDIIERYGPRFNGTIEMHYGKTGYWENHLFHLQNQMSRLKIDSKLNCVGHNFQNHNDVIPVFEEAIAKQIGMA
jgi:hypothetical protein